MNGGSRTTAAQKRPGEKSLETRFKSQLVALVALSNTRRVLVPPMRISST